MNQRRVGLSTLAAGILMVFAGGNAMGRFIHERNQVDFILFVFLLAIGAWALGSIYRTANAWSWNVTLGMSEYLPKGTWEVAAMYANLRMVYVIIRCPTNLAALSVLELSPLLVKSADYKSMLDRRIPLKVSITSRSIEFTWPSKTPSALFADGSF